MPNKYLTFDGRYLDYHEDDKIVKSWRAMSGNKDYQQRRSQKEKNLGPLPEGKWHVRQRDVAFFDDLPLHKQVLNRAGFKMGFQGGKPSWGNGKVYLEPLPETDTKGRGGFHIHGGNQFGSGGCIDLERGLDSFLEHFQNLGEDLILEVKYPNEEWEHWK